MAAHILCQDHLLLSFIDIVNNRKWRILQLSRKGDQRRSYENPEERKMQGRLHFDIHQ